MGCSAVQCEALTHDSRRCHLPVTHHSPPPQRTAISPLDRSTSQALVAPTDQRSLADMADYSDDEVQMMDDGDTEAQMMGEAQAFDAATGMPVPSGSNGAAMDDDAADARRAALAEVAGVSSSSSSSPSIETWQLTLAEKNQSNTQDITVPHMIGIDEAGRGPVLGQIRLAHTAKGRVTQRSSLSRRTSAATRIPPASPPALLGLFFFGCAALPPP